MTCHEFEAAWDAILDAETPERRALADADPEVTDWLSDRETAAAAHARECALCTTAHRRYRTLRRALRATQATQPSVPTPSPALAERILADVEKTRPPSRRRRFLVPLAVALAASILGVLVLPVLRGPRIPGPPSPPASSPPGATPNLSGAVADATAATWDLARATSEPAARFGRQLIEVALQSEEPGDSPPLVETPTAPQPALLPLVLRVVTPSRTGSELLQDVGDEVSAGVRPLSAGAREAFGFLRTPTFRRADGRPRRPLSKGA